ncbi:hypothetical protein MNB_SV-12-1854 [hydrothermal vent metagenome]|uniref:Uncharacterized protein n=1 Tax=hydrothermal vent metagenome TaxID=652676 RepID=A0A1W1CLG9_9ZZZZ
MATRNIKYGNDLFKTLETSNPDVFFDVTYWDLWIAILVNNRFNNKWEDLITYLRKNHSHYHDDDCEGIIAHIEHLHNKLSHKGLTFADILIDIDNDLMKKQEKKAKSKIIKFSFRDGEKSDWMYQTPRNIFYKEALYGHWDIFPINPKQEVEALQKKFKTKSFYTEDQSFALEDKLTSYIEKKEKKASLAELFALYRAFLSVILENINNIDDSYGVIGDLTGDVFKGYLELDWRELSIDTSEYLNDIIKYIIWEDYGLTYEIYPILFTKLTKAEIKIAKSILQSEQKKLAKYHLDYQAKEASSMLKLL